MQNLNYSTYRLSELKDKIKDNSLKIVCDILIVDCNLIAPYLNIKIYVKIIVIEGDYVIKINGLKKKNNKEVLL